VVKLRESGGVVNEDAFRYLNRLSDALFVLARVAAGEAEPISRTE
jgi:cob(I)alamin adenosyltransferase